MQKRAKILKNKGFTLLEVAITMTIVSVLMIFAMQAYTKYRVDEVRRITAENVKNANTKIVEFLSLNARYPCPSGLGLERDDSNYGLEGNCVAAAGAAGTCNGDGICVEEGARLVADLGVNPTVRRGALPFRSLNMPEAMAYDGYGNRLQYAVTEVLTASATYNPNHGAIEINDSNDVTVLSQPATAQFIVVSSGSNALGAYTMDGVRTSDCSAATTNDAENCNTSAANDQAVYRAMAHDFTVANEYDDVVAYDTASEAPAWQFTDASAISARQIGDDDVLLKDDGAGTPKGARLEIGGEIRVDGETQANLYCTDTVDSATPTNEECFETDKIAGDIASGGGMECPSGTILTGIRNSQPICTSALAIGSCPDGTLLKGVDADLSPICDTPPVTCPEITLNYCGENQTYPLTAHGDEVTRNYGFSYWRRYRCNGGSWQYRARGGSCSCSAYEYTQNYSCGTGYTGRRYRDIEVTCDDGVRRVTYGSWDRSDCECVGYSSTQTTSCPSGMTGTRTRERTMNCPAGNWSYGGWSSVEDSCTCVPRDPQTRVVSCGSGMAGVKHEYKEYLCPQAQWSNVWQTDASKTTCTCVDGLVENKSASDCPSGQIGTVYYTRTSNCDAGAGVGSWGPWTEVSNTCRAQSCVWRPLSNSTSGSYGTGAGGVGDPCTCGRANTGCYLQKGASSFDNYAECACQLDE